jgi:hypothetical protein
LKEKINLTVTVILAGLQFGPPALLLVDPRHH